MRPLLKRSQDPPIAQEKASHYGRLYTILTKYVHSAKPVSKTYNALLRITSAIEYLSSTKGNDADLFWTLYNAKAAEYTHKKLASASTDLDSLLTFAGLFSGVDTAFIAMTLSFFSDGQPGTTNTQAAVINGFFIASLSCSVLAAFGAVIGKQWIASSLQRLPKPHATAQEAAIDHQMQLSAIEEWRLLESLDFLPLVLQFSIFTFWVGTTIYLWHRLHSVAVAILIFASIGGVWYGFFFGVANLDPHSPFQTPVSRLLSFWKRTSVLGFLGTLVIFVLRYVAFLIFFTVFYVNEFFRERPDLYALHSFVIIGVDGQMGELLSRTPESEDSSVMNPPDFAFKCIQWALEEVVDDDIALEAARLIPQFSRQDTIRQFAKEPPAFNPLLHQFLKCILKPDVEMSINALVTFSAAIAHVLLSLPPRTLTYDALITIHEALRDLCSSSRQSSRVLAGLPLFADVLSGRYTRIESSPFIVFGPSQSQIVIQSEFLSALEADYIRNLPILYLALSFGSRTTGADMVTDCERLYASKLPPRQAISLVYWLMFKDSSCRFDPDEDLDVDIRWRAYTSSNEVTFEVDQIHRVLLPEDCFKTATVSPPLLYTILDDASRLQRDNLGQGQGIKNGLFSLLSYLEIEREKSMPQHQSPPISISSDHSFSHHPPSPSSPLPCILIRLASHDQVDESTRSRALKETSRLLPKWIKGSSNVANWATSFVDGLVGCFESGIEGPLVEIRSNEPPNETSNERPSETLRGRFQYVRIFATEMKEHDFLREALLDVPLRALQRRIQDLREDAEGSPAFGIASTLSMDYRSSQHHSDVKTPYRRTLNIVLLSLAIWDALGDDPSGDASMTSTIDRALVRWKDLDVMDCVRNLVQDAKGTNNLPNEVQSGLRKYAAFVESERPMTFEVVQFMNDINPQAQGVDHISTGSGLVGDMGTEIV